MIQAIALLQGNTQAWNETHVESLTTIDRAAPSRPPHQVDQPVGRGLPGRAHHPSPQPEDPADHHTRGEGEPVPSGKKPDRPQKITAPPYI